MNCAKTDCPAYQNECGRCWLIAGTLCKGIPQGKFVHKYKFCTRCDFFEIFVARDPVRKLRELIIILIHSLQSKHLDLEKSFSDIKILKGFLPICAKCKKIRDDKGYWSRIESYIRKNSEADFTHSLCPECAKRLYPHIF